MTFGELMVDVAMTMGKLAAWHNDEGGKSSVQEALIFGEGQYILRLTPEGIFELTTNVNDDPYTIAEYPWKFKGEKHVSRMMVIARGLAENVTCVEELFFK